MRNTDPGQTGIFHVAMGSQLDFVQLNLSLYFYQPIILLLRSDQLPNILHT